MVSKTLAVTLRSVLLLACAAGARGAGGLFDRELHRAALAPALCARQLAGMRRADFYDASFRAPEGLLAGNLASLGNYHQCLAISQDFPDANIQGKYCLIRAPLTPPTVRIPSLAGASVSENVTWTEVALPEGLTQKYAGKSLSLAVCVPKACAVEAVLAPYTAHPVVGFNYTEQYCRLPDDKPFVAADYVAAIVFSVIGILTLISTAYELRHMFILRKDPEQASELLRTCSLVTNTRRLLTLDKPRALDCVDGIRSLSILWIVVFHCFCVKFNASDYVFNSFETLEWPYKIEGLWIASATSAVNTFFTMTGILLVYTTMKKTTQTSLLRNLHTFYLSRYLRLFPLLACAVLLQASLAHRVADGPGWHAMAEQVGRCRRYWWSALLHVQNIVNTNETCVIPSWYLSVDMQLHIASPLVLYWVLGSRRAARAALAASVLASIAATVCLCFVFNFPISRIAAGATPDEEYTFKQFYSQNPLVRSPPFLIGMLFGYILHVYKNEKVKLSQRTILACHTLALVAFVYVIYVVHPSMQADWENQFADNINNSLRPACWALAVGWLIFACVHGYGGPVNWFLSLRLWKFVARISYAMFLLHFHLQLRDVGAAVTPVRFDVETLLSSFAVDLIYTTLLSIAACIVIEGPALTLHTMVFRGPLKPKQKPTADENHNNVKHGTKIKECTRC